MSQRHQDSWIDKWLKDHLNQLGPPKRQVGNRPPRHIVHTSINRSPEAIRAGDHSAPEDHSAIDPKITAGHSIQTSHGEIWLEGNALLCRCPDCTAPMTIRIWLGLADCWRCESSIELSEEQLQQVQEILQQNVPQQSAAVAPAPTSQRIAPRLDFPDPEAHAPIPPSVSDRRAEELERLTEESVFATFLKRGFSITPAWVISFLLHLVAILILALIVLNQEGPAPETITLSASFDSTKNLGGEMRIENPLDALQDNLPLASQMDIEEREIRHVLAKANQDARQLLVDRQPVAPLPDIRRVKKNITTRVGPSVSFAARDPRVRTEIVRREGGTTLTEAAVARGLRWLASVQNRDGSWSLKGYAGHRRRGNRGDAMATSLALLPFLGAGQTHEFGMYKQTVAKGLAWLIENQEENGDLRAGYKGRRKEAGMYAHGQGAIVLCEALAMTGDEQFREPAQKAINFIEEAQHHEGGWRYNPKQAGDLSVTGWQIMALQSARAPRLGLKVDPDTIKLADYFLDKVTFDTSRSSSRYRMIPKGSLYSYQPNQKATAPMTAEAILCRMYFGWRKNDPRMMAAIKWLVEENLPRNSGRKNLYYWYYATQVMHHYGGEPWEIWNRQMRHLLISTQETRGEHPGSWDPDDFQWGERGGRIYTTAIAVCTLEVYYRHLPLFKQIELDE